VNLIAVSHYLEALDWQRDVIRLHTVFGGKNPHPHFMVGGMSCAINLSDTQTINAESLSLVRACIDRAQVFVEQVYWPDVLAIAGFYKEWAAIGGGTRDFLACGEFPEGDITDLRSLYFPRGIVLGGDISRVHEYDPAKVLEHIDASWYEYEGGKDALHPYEGQTKPKYTGPKPPWQYLQDQPDKKYTWMKAPRYEGRPMQVGPLARVLVAYAAGHEDVRAATKEIMDRLQVGPGALFSTLGRVAARGLETLLIARRMNRWYDMLVTRIRNGDVSTYNAKAWDPGGWPSPIRGYGFLDAPRGALGHWVVIENGKVKNYQCVVPSTWNCSPRDAKGHIGPYEAALLDNHPLIDPKRPLEILRTIHSFDPCMACGVHVLDAAGEPLVQVRVG
jgi:Ni,Fe-hydrogenase I large subunit